MFKASSSNSSTSVNININEIWATSEGLHHCLLKHLGTSAHIINPELGSVHSIFNNTPALSEQAAYEYAKKIVGFESAGVKNTTGFIQAESGTLKKPIVIPFISPKNIELKLLKIRINDLIVNRTISVCGV